MLSKGINKFLSMKSSIRCLYLFAIFIVLSGCLARSAMAQSTEQIAETDSQVEGDLNNVIQIPNQNNIQNNNHNAIELSNIAPLVSPPNTENDFGFNLSIGVNQSETTAYVGVIFQPGRTKAHQLRVQRLEQQIELLETQTQIADKKLKLIERRVSKKTNQ